MSMAKPALSQYHSVMKSPRLALAFLVTAASVQMLLAGALTASEVVSLLKADVGERVILAQVRAAGAVPALSAREILQLKQAGASDELLEALIGETSETTIPKPTNTPKGGLRVYRETGPDGEAILHVTNLDEAGRRIGGELPPQAATKAAQPPAGLNADAGHDADYGRETPVIVNVYPPSPAGAGDLDDGYRQGAIYTGYLGLPATGFCSRCPAPGHGHNRPPRVDDGGLFSRPPVIDTRPFRAHTAAERNRARFGN